MYSICQVVSISKNLVFLDLSWSRLFPKDLAKLSQILSHGAWCLRNLNLSYNRLEFDPNKKEERVYSNLFMSNMERFFWEALFINHVNFSGMNLNEEQVRTLIRIFKGCQFLLGIHLSDNNIAASQTSKSSEYFHEIMQIFGIRNLDLQAINRYHVFSYDTGKCDSNYDNVVNFLDRKSITFNHQDNRPAWKKDLST